MLRKTLYQFDQNTFMSFEKSEDQSKALINSQALVQFECFDTLHSLGSELWEEHFDSLLRLVKDYTVNI